MKNRESDHRNKIFSSPRTLLSSPRTLLSSPRTLLSSPRMLLSTKKSGGKYARKEPKRQNGDGIKRGIKAICISYRPTTLGR
jgi:hypothetical protein